MMEGWVKNQKQVFIKKQMMVSYRSILKLENIKRRKKSFNYNRTIAHKMEKVLEKEIADDDLDEEK